MVMPRDHAKQRRAALNGFCWQLVRIFPKWCMINLGNYYNAIYSEFAAE